MQKPTHRVGTYTHMHIQSKNPTHTYMCRTGTHWKSATEQMAVWANESDRQRNKDRAHEWQKICIECEIGRTIEIHTQINIILNEKHKLQQQQQQREKDKKGAEKERERQGECLRRKYRQQSDGTHSLYTIIINIAIICARLYGSRWIMSVRFIFV